MKLLLSSMLLLATACNMSDDYHDLGSGFTYVGEGGKQHYISGGNISRNTAIYGNVLSYNSDENCIIAKQEPSREEYKREIGSDLWANFYRYHDFILDSVEWKSNWPKHEVYAIRKFGSLYIALKNKEYLLKIALLTEKSVKYSLTV